MPRTFDVEIDAASVRRSRAMLAKYEGKPMQDRMRKGTLSAARLMVGPVKSQTPVKTGRLQKSIAARASRQVGVFGKAITAYVGPTAYHGHLVVRGHRIVGPRPRKVDTGRRSKANPFVDRAVSQQLGRALRTVADAIWKG